MATGTQSIVFSLAVGKFKALLTEKQKTDFQFVTLKDLEKSLGTIQSRHRSQNELQAMGRLSRFLEVMDQFDKVIKDFVSNSEYVAFIWGPMKLLLETSSAFTEGFNILLNAYQDLGDSMPLLIQYREFLGEHHHMQRILSLMYEDILEFHSKALLYFRHSAWKKVINALWKTSQTDFGDVLKRLRCYKDLIEGQANIIHFEKSLKAQEDAAINLKRTKALETDMQKSRVLQWLRAADVAKDQDNFTRIRRNHPNTGHWIFKLDIFKSWFDLDFCSNPLLWITGIPGAVLDGLDECQREDRKEITKNFQSIIDSMPSNKVDKVRCVFVCQNDGFARKDLAMVPCIRIGTENKSDIQEYAVYWSGKIQEKFELDHVETERIVNLITDRSDGMFLFARLMTRNLLDQTSRESLETELEPATFPNGDKRLAQVYSRNIRRLFENVDQRRKDDVTRLLGWLLWAKRPLKWREYQGAMAIDMESQDVLWERRKLREDSKDLCGSLVEIRDNDAVELVHSTAKTYLPQYLDDSTSEELRIATLCLGYLSLPGFERNMLPTDIKSKLIRGYYTFADYAVAYWATHLDSAVARTGANTELDELSETIQGFLDLHLLESEEEHAPPKAQLNRLDKLRQLDSFKELATAVSVAKNQLNVYSQTLTSENVLDIIEILGNIRATLEETFTASTSTVTEIIRLQEFHGPNFFKCPRIRCVYFHKGFGSCDERDRHVQQHERSFFCSFSSCLYATLGISTQEELQKHETEKHNAIPEEEFDPEDLAEKLPQSFDCPDCDRRFTRKHNLDIHVRTHKKGDSNQSYDCRECGKHFARQGDRTRHEKSFHSDGNKFVCGGTLEDGSKWGCGREFNRSDGLARHFTSQQGKNCTKNLPKADAVGKST